LVPAEIAVADRLDAVTVAPMSERVFERANNHCGLFSCSLVPAEIAVADRLDAVTVAPMSDRVFERASRCHGPSLIAALFGHVGSASPLVVRYLHERSSFEHASATSTDMSDRRGFRLRQWRTGNVAAAAGRRVSHAVSLAMHP